MSKQADLVKRILECLFDDVKSEVGLEKITGIKMHRGIDVDFHIPSLNLALEIHGIQHEKAQSFGGTEIDAYKKLNMQLNRDSKLRDICEKFNINYEEIWYNEKVNISSVYNLLEKYMDKDNE